MFLAGLVASSGVAAAHHGPSTTGAGLATQAAETLGAGHFSFELRLDATEFRAIPTGDLAAMAMRAGHLELLDRSILTTLSFAYGVTSRLQLGMSLPYYSANGSRTAHPGLGDPLFATSHVDGLGDLWLTAKYRFFGGSAGSLALFAGAKLPTGRCDVLDSLGDPVDPSSTAGSGTYDFLFGVAYARALGGRSHFALSFQYTLQGTHDNFDIGDRIDTGVALAYRLNEDSARFPQVALLAELNLRHLFASVMTTSMPPRFAPPEPDPHSRNTGGTTVFLSPGLRLLFTKELMLTLELQVPLAEHLYGEQVQTAFKGVASMALFY
jgi:hypothetical protein